MYADRNDTLLGLCVGANSIYVREPTFAVLFMYPMTVRQGIVLTTFLISYFFLRISLRAESAAIHGLGM